MAENGFISNRLFDAVACGCPVLSDYCEGVETIFGDSVISYTSEQEFLNGLIKIGKDPENYKKNAELWSQKIRDHHSFDKRVEEIHSLIVKYVTT
jgi:spore maturation protein CgeB